MYLYNEYDRKIVAERVEQYRGQVKRYLAGELTEDQFRPLRLMNGLYVQTHAPMLRIAVPYGMLSSTQVRKLADVARTYDKGYGHITTRQNMQLNWPKLEKTPDILHELASVEMHAIQTSGNCIRNVTTDHLAGVAADELEDPRPYCEIIRQWSTFHPEFTYLPRKFKIAICGTEQDRAAVPIHDVGLYLVKNDSGEVGFRVNVGGGLGRLPYLSVEVRDFIEKKYILAYLEAIVRIYNLEGNRVNKRRARIKVLVDDLGVDAFREKVEAEFEHLKDSTLLVDDAEIERAKSFFTEPAWERGADEGDFAKHVADDKKFALWVRNNVKAHKVDGYAAAFVSLKGPHIPPGDILDEQMEGVADLADQYSFSEIRTTHDQNLVLADVKKADLYAVFQGLQKLDLDASNIGLLTDMICCPGLDYCALANAGSINVSQQIMQRFDDIDYLHDLGEIKLKMSGCMNACGHHHVGHIGILGVEKRGEEWYQILLGGSAENDSSLAKNIGRAVPYDAVSDVLAAILDTYVEQRTEDERFIDTYRRVGVEPFKASAAQVAEV